MWFLSGFCYWLLISTSFLLPYFFLFFFFHTHSCDILLSSSISFFLVPVASICSPFCSPLFSLLRPLFFLFFSLSPTPPLLFYLLPLYTSLSSFSTSSLASPLHLRSLPSPLLSFCFFLLIPLFVFLSFLSFLLVLARQLALLQHRLSMSSRWHHLQAPPTGSGIPHNYQVLLPIHSAPLQWGHLEVKLSHCNSQSRLLLWPISRNTLSFSSGFSSVLNL